jgi:CSLREA domain-containing protein
MMRPVLHFRMLLSLLAVLAFGVAALTLATPARPAFAETITVTTTEDENSSDGDCALREAVISANRNTSRDRCPAGTGNDTIVLPAGTYTFAIAPVPNSEPYDGAGDLDLLDAAGVTIQGAGPGRTIINAAGLDRSTR